MAAEPLTVSRLLGTARTSDLYDVITLALNLLTERGEVAITDNCIGLEHAEIYRESGTFAAVYWSEVSAEEAERQRGDQEGGF